MKFDIKGTKEKGEALLNMLKRRWMLAAVLVLGIILLCFPGDSGEDTPVQAAEKRPEFSLEEEEKRIAHALERIDGVGNVSVVLTLKSSVEQRIARDESTDYRSLEEGYELNSESAAVLIKRDKEESPVVLKYLYPEYKGALIVADNANAAMRLELTNAVAALTGLSTEKISVVPGKFN